MSDDLGLLRQAAAEAARIALSYWRQSPDVEIKPDGAGPVSEADLAVDRHLREMLTAERPGYGWLSEETEDDLERLSRERVFIVDPIDGTRSFIAGDPTWSHSIAVAEGGRITAAIVLLPAMEREFLAGLNQGAFLNDERIAASDREEIDGATILAAKSNLQPAFWRQDCPPFNRQFRSSLAYRLALVGQGRFDGMLTLRRTWEWDVAAGSLIASEAGAEVTDRAGSPPVFNNEAPVLNGMIAAPAALSRQLHQRLAPPDA